MDLLRQRHSGVLIYRPSLNANFFRTPHLIAIGYTVFGILIATYLWWFMARANFQRARKLDEIKPQLLKFKAEQQSGNHDVGAGAGAGEDGSEVVEAVDPTIEAERKKGDRAVTYVYQL